MSIEHELPTAELPTSPDVSKKVGPTSSGELRLDHQRLNHYEIITELGRGGMGVVHSAYDTTLHRKVAIKQMLADDPQHYVRSLREARALAMLSHPNVVQVHEVIEHGDSVTIVMEFVDGATLADWLKTPRSRVEILSAFKAAIEGLAAAHAKGLVHRDFKPANVMVGIDGRVRVMDFGLVRVNAPKPNTGGSPMSGVDYSAGPGSLTLTGTILGTPRYMSPEQLEGQRADAASDQFSFCVALYEALYGEQPFAGIGFEAIKASVLRGDLRGSPRGSDVPRWLRELLYKGLAIKPEDRFASLRDLLDAIIKGEGARARTWSGVAVASMAFLASYYIVDVTIDREIPRTDIGVADGRGASANPSVEVEQLRARTARDKAQRWVALASNASSTDPLVQALLLAEVPPEWSGLVMKHVGSEHLAAFPAARFQPESPGEAWHIVNWTSGGDVMVDSGGRVQLWEPSSSEPPFMVCEDCEYTWNDDATFMLATTPQGKLRVLDRYMSDVALISDAIGPIRSFVWDGDHILTMSERGAVRVWSQDGEELRPRIDVDAAFEDEFRPPQWSPDRSRALYETSNGAYAVLDVQTGVEHLLPFTFPARRFSYPRFNLTRYHGVFAARSKHRSEVVPGPKVCHPALFARISPTLVA